MRELLVKVINPPREIYEQSWSDLEEIAFYMDKLQLRFQPHTAKEKSSQIKSSLYIDSNPQADSSNPPADSNYNPPERWLTYLKNRYVNVGDSVGVTWDLQLEPELLESRVVAPDFILGKKVLRIGVNIRLFFAWYDFWVGFYYDQKRKILYFCPLPMLVIAVSLR